MKTEETEANCTLYTGDNTHQARQNGGKRYFKTVLIKNVKMLWQTDLIYKPDFIKKKSTAN